MSKRLMEGNVAGMVLAGLWLVSLCGPAAGQTRSFQAEDKVGGYKGVEDTYLQSARPDAAAGGHASLGVGKNASSGTMKILLRFDLRGLRGRYKTIKGARLKLTIKRTEGRFKDLAADLHRLAAANAGWAAGRSRKNTESQIGAACWNFRRYDSTMFPPNHPRAGQPYHVAWAGGAGLGRRGYSPKPLASAKITAGPKGRVVWTFRNVDLLDRWIKDHASNQGLLLQIPKAGRGAAVHLFSSEARLARARPVLEIDLEGYRAEVTGIHYMLAEPGRVSLLISDSRGRVVRELLHASSSPAGVNVAVWDAKDRGGKIVKSGTYKWKLLQTQGLKAEYLMPLGVNVDFPWPGNHMPVSGVTADKDHVWVTGWACEGPRMIVKMSTDGKQYVNSVGHYGPFSGMFHATVDGQNLYLCDYNRGQVHWLDKDTLQKKATWNLNRKVPWDLKARDGKLVVTFQKTGGGHSFRWLDPADGSTIRDIEGDFRSASLDSKGRAIVLTEKRVLRFNQDSNKGVPVVTAGIVHGLRLDVDPRNDDILVADIGAQQVKRFSSRGKPIAAYGKKGGRARWGIYKTGEGFLFDLSSHISCAPDGSFWVTEAGTTPHRTAHYSAKGRIIKEFYGGQHYGTFGAFDPGDPTLALVTSTGGLMEFKIDYAKRTSELIAIYSLTVPELSPPPKPWKINIAPYAGFVIRRQKKGRRMLCTLGTPAAYVLDRRRGRLVPATVTGSTNSLKPSLRPKKAGTFIFIDRNGDGKVSRNELKMQAAMSCSSYVSKDFTLYHAIAGAAYRWASGEKVGFARIAPRGFARGGAPKWSVNYWDPKRYKRMGEPFPAYMYRGGGAFCFGDKGLWADEQGNVYGAFHGDYGEPGQGFWSGRTRGIRVAKWDSKGKLQWIVGRHARGGGAGPGEMRYIWRISGMAHDNVVVSDIESPNFHVWDRDGLWVGRLLENHDFKYIHFPENFGSNGMYTVGKTESIPGLKAGDVLLAACQANSIRVFRVSGWDRFNRQQGSVVVSKGKVVRSAVSRGR